MSELLLDSRCTFCGWTGKTDLELCPGCGHGLTDYTVTLAKSQS